MVYSYYLNHKLIFNSNVKNIVFCCSKLICKIEKWAQIKPYFALSSCTQIDKSYFCGLLYNPLTVQQENMHVTGNSEKV